MRLFSAVFFAAADCRERIFGFHTGKGVQVTRAQLENIINMILMILDDCKDLEEAKEKVAGIVKKEQQKDSGR